MVTEYQQVFPKDTDTVKKLTYPLIKFYEALRKYNVITDQGEYVPDAKPKSAIASLGAEKVLFYIDGKTPVTKSTLEKSLYMCKSDIWDKISTGLKEAWNNQFWAVRKAFDEAKDLVASTIIWAAELLGKTISAVGQGLGFPGFLTIGGILIGGYVAVQIFNKKGNNSHGS